MKFIFIAYLVVLSQNTVFSQIKSDTLNKKILVETELKSFFSFEKQDVFTTFGEYVVTMKLTYSDKLKNRAGTIITTLDLDKKKYQYVSSYREIVCDNKKYLYENRGYGWWREIKTNPIDTLDILIFKIYNILK